MRTKSTSTSTKDTSSNTIEDLAALQATALELHAAYLSAAGRHLTEDFAEIAELGRSYLEALAKAESFSAAFQIGIDFEDNASDRLKDLVEVNATALKGLGDELASLYKPREVKSTKPATVKKASGRAKAPATA